MFLLTCSICLCGPWKIINILLYHTVNGLGEALLTNTRTHDIVISSDAFNVKVLIRACTMLNEGSTRVPGKVDPVIHSLNTVKYHSQSLANVESFNYFQVWSGHFDGANEIYRVCTKYTLSYMHCVLYTLYLIYTVSYIHCVLYTLPGTGFSHTVVFIEFALPNVITSRQCICSEHAAKHECWWFRYPDLCDINKKGIP